MIINDEQQWLWMINDDTYYYWLLLIIIVTIMNNNHHGQAGHPLLQRWEPNGDATMDSPVRSASPVGIEWSSRIPTLWQTVPKTMERSTIFHGYR